MYMRKLGMLVAVTFLLSSCASDPAPQSREEWRNLHTTFYPGVSPDQALAAAEKVLRLADHDFKFDYPDGQLQGVRGWHVYKFLGNSVGTDWWRVAAVAKDGGSEVQVQISRYSGLQIGMYGIAEPPISSASNKKADPNDAQVGGAGMPAGSVRGAFPYELFRTRMMYMLGMSQTWQTCREAQAEKTYAQLQDSGILCNMSANDDKPPEIAHPQRG